MYWLALLLFLNYHYSTNPVKIGVIGDTQYISKKKKRVFARAIKDMNRQRISFMIHLGDQDEGGRTKRYRHFKRRVSSLLAPYFLVLGNHELSLSRRAYFIWAPLRKRWKSFWGYRKTYQYFEAHGFRFLLLDTSMTFSRKSHARWFSRMLDKYIGKKKAFLFMHRPLPIPYAMTMYYDNGKRHVYEDMQPLPYFGHNNKELWRIFYRNRHKIAAIFHGHYHAFRRYSLFGVKAFCSGGGGGGLEKKSDFHHYLLVSLKTHSFRVDIRKL